MKKPTILMVDDSPENLEVLYFALKDDYELVATADSMQAWKSARINRPDLILLDIMMPGKDGFEVCAELKADEATRNIPILFLTAKTEPESELKALAAGGADFIQKPIHPEVVRTHVRLHLELAQHRHHLEELVHARTRELEASRDAAESASRAKCAFLAVVGHELRTPMNIILGNQELLEQEALSEPGRRRLSDLKEASWHLLGLLNQMLDYASSQAEEIQIKSIDFSLAGLAQNLENAFQERARAKGLLLACEIDPFLPDWLKGDPVRLHQVWGVLLDNAVKFSEEGRITLRIRQIGSHPGHVRVRFEVQDQGIGIDPAMRSDLYQIFSQGDSSFSRKYEGMGLGLALCKRLVSLMGGETGYRSAPGEGSLFWFDLRLPLGQAPESH